MDGKNSLADYPEAKTYFGTNKIPAGEGFLYMGGGYTGKSWAAGNRSIMSDNDKGIGSGVANKNPGPRTVALAYCIVK